MQEAKVHNEAINDEAINIHAVVAMQVESVRHWHEIPPSASNADWFAGYDSGFLAIAIRQHRFNYDLWHEEDIARSPDVSDARIAEVKRAIDRLNQQRNDWIEKLDDWLTDFLETKGITATTNAKLNSETPGSAVDRLSIMALRIYHLEEQLSRSDASQEHLSKVRSRLAICQQQQTDLAQSLTELLADIRSGMKRHRTYRQFKMYNDPTMNPYLYSRKSIEAASE